MGLELMGGIIAPQDDFSSNPKVPSASAPAADPIHRTDLLPGNCPHCGAPVRPAEVKWTGAQSASCGFCSSNLPMKKQ
jgi:hypothetical protein